MQGKNNSKITPSPMFGFQYFIDSNDGGSSEKENNK